jgi:hypothetical protein
MDTPHLPDSSPPAPPPAVSTAATAGPGVDSTPSRTLLALTVLFVAALLCCMVAYLALAVPGSWFPGASTRAWGAKDLTLARGTGGIVDDELMVAAMDATGNALVTLTSDFRSADYAAVAWIAIDVPDQADVRLFWRTDYRPDKLNQATVGVDAGHVLPTLLNKDPAWIGRITGLALAIHSSGPLAKPIRVRGALAKPMGAVEILGDRASEWLAFEGWNGASINTITGGADIQDLPLPMLVAAALLLSGGVYLGWHRFRPAAAPVPIAFVLIVLLVIGWFVLDARWTWNFARQVRATAAEFGGKDNRDRHLAMEDGQLYAFIEKTRALMPKEPARVFVVSDLPYFRERAAYHLYPHNVYADNAASAMPPANRLRPGDWLVAYREHGIQFDAAQGKLRWDGNQIVNAELKFVEPGSAVFLIR